jgi:HlyD family secretion protein
VAEKKIFREAALERLSTPDRLDQGLKIVGSAEWIGLGALVALIVIGAIWALVLRVPITVAGSGILLECCRRSMSWCSERLMSANMTKISVAPGDQVKAGQEIAKLDQSELQSQLETAVANGDAGRQGNAPTIPNVTQAIVTQSVSQLAVTRIVIAHRLTTVRSADRIYVFDKGRIAQNGKYDELIKAPGPFAEFAKRQLV